MEKHVCGGGGSFFRLEARVRLAVFFLLFLFVSVACTGCFGGVFFFLLSGTRMWYKLDFLHYVFRNWETPHNFWTACSWFGHLPA